MMTTKRLTTYAGIALLMLAVLPLPSRAVTHLKHGAAAPDFELTDLDGQAVDTKLLRGRIVILVFGELYHSKTIQACKRMNMVLKDTKLSGALITPLLIVSQKGEAAELKAEAAEKPFPSVIVRDVQRTAFEQYRVAVLPSVVVVDKNGLVVHAIAAFTDRFSDVLTHALLLASGAIDRAQFEQRMHPDEMARLSPETIRARRLTELARQLSQRGLLSLAEQKYDEALQSDDNYAPAHLGWGMLQLRRRRWPQAEQRFRDVMARDAESVPAALGLAFVHIFRGGDELKEAESLMRRVLVKHPSQPRAHYLMGLIHEKRGDLEQAAASFKEAAALLLQQTEQGFVS
jgi:Tfp pilus assembly protein PilF/peroxiredoxin